MKFWKNVVICTVVCIAGCGSAWSQTPTREVSGVGAQASAHGVNSAGTLLDVQVLVNVTPQSGQSNGGETLPVVVVLLKATSPSFEKKSFGALPTTCSKSWYSSDGVFHVEATVKLVEIGRSVSSESRVAEVILNWNTDTKSETVSAQNSYKQPGTSIGESLRGALQRTKVSGSVSIDCFSVPLVTNEASYWTTNNKSVTRTCCSDSEDTANASSAVTPNASATASPAGYWTGYWIWNGTDWMWTWIWVSSSGAFSVS